MFSYDAKRYQSIETILRQERDYYIAIDLQLDRTWTAAIINTELSKFNNLHANANTIKEAMQELNTRCLERLEIQEEARQ